jgi:iron complex outermembrane recepter protein
VTGKKRVVNYSSPATLERDLEGLSLTADFSVLNGHTLTYIGASRQSKSEQLGLDSDASPGDYIQAFFFDEAKHSSHEIRLTSPQNQKFSYIVGAYLFDQTAKTDRTTSFGQTTNQSLFGGSLLAPGFSLADLFNLQGVFPVKTRNIATLETKSQALFISGEYHLTDTLTLTGGIRYTSEEKNLSAVQTDGGIVNAVLALGPGPASQIIPGVLPSIAPFTDRIKDEDVSPTIGLNWKPNKDTLVYVRAARGFKSGGYNLDFSAYSQTLNTGNINLPVRQIDFTKLRFEPEQLDSYELGFKTLMMNRKLQLTGAMFLIDYSSIQLLRFEIPAFVPANASAESKGFELEVLWKLNSNWSFDGSVGVTNAKFKDYVVSGSFNAAGLSLDAPKSTSNIGIQYDRSVESLGGKLLARLDWYRQGGTPPKPEDPYSELSAFSVVNANIGFKSNMGWEVNLYATNLLDSDHSVSRNTSSYLGNIANVGQEFTSTADPRQVRLRLAYKF